MLALKHQFFSAGEHEALCRAVSSFPFTNEVEESKVNEATQL